MKVYLIRLRDTGLIVGCFRTEKDAELYSQGGNSFITELNVAEYHRNLWGRLKRVLIGK